MNPIWLFRMARWARNPPSEARVKLVLAIVGICLLVFAVEYFVGWPEMFTMEPRGWRFTP